MTMSNICKHDDNKYYFFFLSYKSWSTQNLNMYTRFFVNILSRNRFKFKTETETFNVKKVRQVVFEYLQSYVSYIMIKKHRYEI